MESEVGSAPSGFGYSVKEANNGSSSERRDALSPKSLDEERHNLELEYRNNDVSCFAEVNTSNVARKKRGKRAPPSSKCLPGKKVDKVIGNDDGADNHNDATECGRAGKNQVILNNEECVDERSGGLDIPKTGHSGSSFDVAYEVCDNSNASEDASNVQAPAVKKATAVNKTSQEIMDDHEYDAQVNTTSSEDESSEEVEDVKVCDICGDVGEEEKLAVCSRCNDGAEHIYCMRVMMEEVPEGEWLCEECQTEVEFEKERTKMEKTELKIGASKGRSFEDKTNKPISAAKSRSSSENEMDNENLGDKDSHKANQRNDVAGKRKEEDAGITSSARQYLTEGVGLSMGANTRKRVPLSRESSFRLDAEKGRQPASQGSSSLASNTAKNQAPPLRGQLTKSTSFNNSKIPKVKQLVNEVPQKTKNLKDSLSFAAKKEGPMHLSALSSSFKKPKSYEPANKEKSSIVPPAEESRVSNPLVSRNVTNDGGTSILGSTSVTGSLADPVPLKAESAGNSELKKPLLAKTPGSISLTNAERSSGILGSGAPRKVIQNSDPSHRDDSIKDPSSLRSGASSSSRTMRCQRCNEVGHFTQFCAVDKLRLSAIKPLSERNLKDASAKRNKTSEATNLVAAEKADSKSADQSEHILKCGPYHNAMYKPKDVLSTSYSHLKKPSQLCVHTEKDLANSLSTTSIMGSTDCSNLKFNERQTQLTMTGRSVENSSTMQNDLMDKYSQGFSSGDELIVSTIPELDYVWQGGFELWRTGKSPELCDGFQAHLSCSASSKVLEVAKKFPSKVQLEELPRQNSWPMQFQENGPTYDNIGLFFFARDTESYENNYSKLVENMLKNDLALRGNIESAELLIFPSNILSKNFQRWNMFYFLWGVFRVKKKDHGNISSDAPISKLQPNLNEDPLAIDLSTSVFSSGHSFSKDQNSGAESDHNFLKSATCADNKHLQTLETNNEGCLNEDNFSNQHLGRRDIKDHHHVSVTVNCSTNSNNAINDFSNTLVKKQQELAYSEEQNKTWDSAGGNAGSSILDVNIAPVTCSISSMHEKDNIVSGKESTTINLNNAENLMDVDHVNITDMNSSELDPVSQVAGGSHKRNAEMASWDDADNGTLDHKKIKLDNIGSVNSSLSENNGDGRLSSKVHPLSASSGDDCTDNKAVAGSSKSNGKYVFPLDLNSVDDALTGNVVDILSSDEEDLPERNAPDLELELGDNRSSKAMFSLFSSKIGEKQNK